MIVSGPVTNDNGAVDYLTRFSITGGTFIASGSAGMIQGPERTSTQPSLILIFPSLLAAGTAVHMEDARGGGAITISPPNPFQSMIISSPIMQL